MVTMSSLEKMPPVAKLSDCLAISQSSAARDHKLDLGGEDRSNGLYKTMSRSMNPIQKMRSDIYLDSTYSKVDRQLVGVIGAQNESSLFSSSLSDLVNHKLSLSAKTEPFKSQEEGDGQTINNLLPDEEELFSGMVDELGLGHGGPTNATNDMEDFDLFGLELESDDHSQAGQRNVGYPNPWSGNHSNQNTIHSLGHASRVLPTPRLPNGNSSIYDGIQSPMRMPSMSSESFPQVQVDSRGIPNFHPHSPQVQLHSVINAMPRNSFDSFTGMANDIRPQVPEKVNLDIRHLGLNGHALELNDGGFGYSPNGIHVQQTLASKSNSYQQHHLRSLLMSNSPSFLNNNHAHHLGRLPGSPGAPHLMMNMVSPVHQLHVGSAPVKASLWDRQQQVYAGESHESPSYQMGSIRATLGIPGFSPPHAREISKDPRMNSPQQMGPMFHERNPMNSLPTTFGSPSERVRSRRNEAHLSHADRKHYELNLDRILRGDDSRTTLMIKNIPNKYTSKMLLATIDEHHRGKYDFIYLPIDFKNKCNMGYAFINMIDPLQIVAFHQRFEGRKWEKFNSEKVASLAYARIQGKSALIAHFQNSSLMNEDKRCRPILFHTDGPNAGDQEPFPVGSGFRPKPGRLQAVGGDEDE